MASHRQDIFQDTEHIYFPTENALIETVSESEAAVNTYSNESEMVDVKPDDIPDPISCAEEFQTHFVEVKEEIKEEPLDVDVQVTGGDRMELKTRRQELVKRTGNEGHKDVAGGPGVLGDVSDSEAEDLFYTRNWCLLDNIVETEENSINWARKNDLVPTEMRCPLCGTLLRAKGSTKAKGFGEFECRRKHGANTRFRMAATKNTIMEDTRLNIGQVLRLIYCFALGSSYGDTINECSYVLKEMSRRTVRDWFIVFREVCMVALETKYSDAPRIGGPGKEVEVDECRIGRRKYHSKRIVKGDWIVGFIETESRQVRVEILPDDKRDFNAFLHVIEKHVESETTVNTDCWSTYTNDKTMKHSLNFVDPSLENSADRLWRPLRQRVSGVGIRHDDFAIHVCEYLWREDCVRLQVDPFMTLVKDIGNLYKGGEVHGKIN